MIPRGISLYGPARRGNGPGRSGVAAVATPTRTTRIEGSNIMAKKSGKTSTPAERRRSRKTERGKFGLAGRG